MLRAKRALVSVSDKSGLAEFARGLSDLGIEILSTGGTYRHLSEAEVPVTKVADVTGYPEIMDGRVKTLHPAIHGGILASRQRASHLSELTEHNIEPIDVVVVNLYPFQKTVETEGATYDEIVEMIDIGGPCMLRAAAKNHQGVVVVVDPGDYPQVLAALQEGEGIVPERLRQQLALKGFRHTQSYDTAISNWLERQQSVDEESGELKTPTPYPSRLHLDLQRELVPRYGENPHQKAAVYRTLGGPGVLGGYQQHQGKDMSWNNLLDADATRKLASLFEEPTVVITKHNNPCGVGRGKDLVEAYKRALSSDPVSAFGSIIATNRPVPGELAEAMRELFVEVVIAESYDEQARKIFSKKKNLRVLECPQYSASESDYELRAIDGGFLAQTVDVIRENASAWKCPTERKPTTEEQRALEFAWKVCRYTKSNAIVVCAENQTYGVGAGQMSRLDSCRLALDKSQFSTEGAVAASDAFFPFRDALDVLAEGGVKAIVQPGGSKRDDEVVAAANEHGIAMLFTGHRHFRH